MTPDELRKSYIDYMVAAGSVEIPSDGLVPENDSTTLFTGSGMQPMVPYLLGQKHPKGDDLSNVQRCVRTGDIDEVGDPTHLTFFEMIGRWQLNADPATYKRRQIELIFGWQTQVLGLDASRVYISVFAGDQALGIPQDDEAIAIWQDEFAKLGIDAKVEPEPAKYGMSRGGRIFLYDTSENWWSRAGVPENMPVGEVGGPDSEMFYDFDPSGPDTDHPAADDSRLVEIGNNVFMSVKKTDDGFVPLPAPNIDYGGGLERIFSAVQGNPDVYRTPFFASAITELEKLTGHGYEIDTSSFRIILDHARAVTFLIGDGVTPSNSDAGYVVRRLLRRAVRVGRGLDAPADLMARLARIYIDEAKSFQELYARADKIVEAITREEEQFQRTLVTGEKEIRAFVAKNDTLDGADAFRFYETYGFPKELTEEVLGEMGKTMQSPEKFDEAAKVHSDKSRSAAAGKFAGGLADHSETTTAYHTATHLLLAGLQRVLGDHVHQMGSNITAERLRYDVSHPQKVTREELDQVEAFINDAIARGATVSVTEMTKQEALDAGIEGSFWEKYPDVVTVYTIKAEDGEILSQELCGGPHVGDLSEVAEFGRVKITKEGSSSSGVRRIRAEFRAA
ncbi:alanine--tRNA ligase [Maribius pontilimi]|uniref:Alanine--tRNA ligase n=1 Tax=Palleronia pontilimi TaxID=1964209 RepID=A0A934MC51_9RHOB|nr:alanine--tRNA ligase [Palleronia pontilimi]MBJ3762408.1 alanine--tRNA ligase [Palleronia pontilimi]